MSFESQCRFVLLALAFFELSCASVDDPVTFQAPIPAPAAAAAADASAIQLASEQRLEADDRRPASSRTRNDPLPADLESGSDFLEMEPAGTGGRPQAGETDLGGSTGDSATELPEAAAQYLEPAPLESGDRAFPINLAAAMRLADARPLIVAAAQAGAWVAEAQLQRAQLLWVPHFNFGALYYRHDGYGPDFNYGVNNPAYGGPTPGGPLNQNINYFYGYGSVFQIVNLSDAIFQPLAARQTLDAQRLDVQTAKNDALLATANAYFDVHEHRGRYAGALDVVARVDKLVDRVEELSRDLVPEVELDRARRMQATVQQRAVLARERWRISSANLTQILRLDPSAVVMPLEQDHLQITLIDPARSLDELIEIGATQRPEIAASSARIRAAEARVRREKNRPLLPLVLITGFQTPGGMVSQFGVFGEGADRSLNQWSLRNDVSLQLIWQLEGLGFGNLARIKQQRGEESQAIVDLFKQQDAVVAEITAAQARVQAAAARVLQTERELREAIVAFDGNFEGLAQTSRFDDILQLVIRPQEAVQALDELSESYDAYFATVAEYNRAQFNLFHALGYPARCASESQTTGDPAEVEVDRPYGLPTVESGPPAANR